MPSLKIIIILISLYGLASTITFITYIIKYNNLKKKCNYESNNLRTEDTNKINNTQSICANNTLVDLSDVISKYDIYYDADLYNKYDLIDEYKDKIIIYSKDINKCYLECDNNKECYGFTKLHNYCFLKGSYDITQKNNASKTVLVLNSNKN